MSLTIIKKEVSGNIQIVGENTNVFIPASSGFRVTKEQDAIEIMNGNRVIYSLRFDSLTATQIEPANPIDPPTTIADLADIINLWI